MLGIDTQYLNHITLAIWSWNGEVESLPIEVREEI